MHNGSILFICAVIICTTSCSHSTKNANKTYVPAQQYEGISLDSASTSEYFYEKRAVNMRRRENVDSIIKVVDSIIYLHANNNMIEFPSSFEVISLYLDSLQSKGLDPYYFFNQLTNSTISKELLLSKLVAASIDGEYKVDTIDCMQEAIRQLAVSYPGLLSNILSHYTTETRLSFWMFFFDTIHPRNYQNICDTLLLNQEIVAEHAFILKAFEDNISKWDYNHNH